MIGRFLALSLLASFAMNAQTVARPGNVALDSLLPVPRQVEIGEGRFRVEKGFQVAVQGHADARIYPGASRFLRRLDGRTGLFLSQDYVRPEAEPVASGLLIQVNRPGEVRLGVDESYRLEISGERLALVAETDIGALRGLETLLQLLSTDEKGYYFPAARIVDEPRFKWRGLMIDSARHFMPMDMIKRNLDGMAAVKLNVMHWHLTEDQGFRVESKKFPRLHEYGSDGMYYTQAQIKEIVAYAAERGIRVYPEFDVPGHATSWLPGHPEIASAPGPYEIERAWGIFNPTLDPTNERTYEILDGLFTEMSQLFPDEYFHIGGDEVHDAHWQANEKIQAYMRANGIADSHALQSVFNKRILEILTRNGKIMIGWDEILQPEMPTNIVIHSWRGRDSMESAAKDGYRSILSNGYYIDLMHPARHHYLNDPLPGDLDLSDEERARVLGGEATMWSEHVTPDTVDSRIWPRTAAIAERLWSDASVVDVDDMYRRLDTISIQLEEHGLTHIRNREMLMRRLVGGEYVEPLRVLADVVEPLKVYRRNHDRIYRSFSPYTLLPDIATADAKDARGFGKAVDYLIESKDKRVLKEIEQYLQLWSDNHERYSSLAERAPALREALPLSLALRDLADLGLAVIQRKKLPYDPAKILERARAPVDRVELQVVDSLERLLEMAGKLGEK